jgi:hypothetical protein
MRMSLDAHVHVLRRRIDGDVVGRDVAQQRDDVVDPDVARRRPGCCERIR